MFIWILIRNADKELGKVFIKIWYHFNDEIFFVYFSSLFFVQVSDIDLHD